MSLRLDDCSHCACVTPLVGYSIESAIEALQTGELGCWNCQDAGEDDHVACVALFDDADKILFDGRCSP